jgi:chromosomal replication initiator protein
LQTRFLSGVLCRVEQPDRDTREQIVVRKAGLLALRLVPESARLLAASSCTSVRELEGLLHTLRNLHRIPDQPVPPGLVRQVVAEIERDCVRVVRLPDIERVICETFGDNARVQVAISQWGVADLVQALEQRLLAG